MKLIGDMLVGNGWCQILVKSGCADAIFKGSHVTKSCYANQVSAAALHVLKKQGYDAYIAALPPYDVPFVPMMSPCSWIYGQIPIPRSCTGIQCKSWLYFHWKMYSLCEMGNFEFYLQSLGQLAQ